MSPLAAKPTMYKLKLPLIGEPSVGKTTLVKAFMGGTLTDRYSPTLGVEIGRKMVNIDLDGQPVEVYFQLWDLGGQASFKTIRGTYYKGAQGLVLVYDIGRHSTFLECEKWLGEAWGITGQVPLVLVGNKLDLRQKGEGEVTTEDGKSYAKNIQEQTSLMTPFIEASAIRARNADTPFKELAKVILRRILDKAE
ncbi:MAG: GTP-binding protein [Candidatus Heimdallarchaeota archaeon]